MNFKYTFIERDDDNLEQYLKDPLIFELEQWVETDEDNEDEEDDENESDELSSDSDNLDNSEDNEIIDLTRTTFFFEDPLLNNESALKSLKLEMIGNNIMNSVFRRL